MYYFLFIIKSSIEDFKRNKLRTFLTSLGILIGVSSVVLLLSFGLGLKAYIKEQFENLGTNIIVIIPGKIFGESSFQGSAGTFGGIKFDEKDLRNLRKIRSQEYIVPAMLKSVTAAGNGKSEITDIYATNEEAFPTRNFEVDLGNFFTKNDVDKKNKVTVLGPKIAEKLFDIKSNALNKTVKIESLSFKVIGVFKSKGGGGFGGPDIDSYAIVPYTSVTSLNPGNKFFAIHIKADSQESIPAVKEEAKKILLKRYKEDEFSVIEQTDILNAISAIFTVLNSILVAIAAISLVVGGIGIMNIMYVSVMERVKEIGLRRSIGATKKDILFQFLSEAIILSLIGGSLGLLIAFLVVFFVQRFFPAYINIQSVVVSLGISSLIGIFFGVMPAKRASELNPIEALRYE